MLDARGKHQRTNHGQIIIQLEGQYECMSGMSRCSFFRECDSKTRQAGAELGQAIIFL